MTDKQLTELTKQFIAIKSTADNPQALREAVDFVANIVRKRTNVTLECFERNGKPSFLAYRGKVRPAKFDILLNAHVDVVPGRPELFEPYEKDGKLYGRGALDMKGTALVLADVFCELVNEVPYALGLQIVSDEEVGGYDGVRLHIDDGVRADFVIMGEYANERHTIYNAARGLCWAEIAFNGKSAHGGHLWNGANAVVKAGDFAAAVLRRYPTPDKETWTTTASIANLATPNDAYNKVPDKAVLKIDFRFTQEDPVFESRGSVEEFIHGIDPEAELVNLATFEPAVNVEKMNPYVQGLSAALKSVTGVKPQYLGRPGGSDGRHYALVNNDTVEFGLSGSGSHSDDEYVELSSFAEYQATLRKFLQKPVPDKQRRSTKATEPLHEQLLRKLVAMPTITADTRANQNALTFVADFLRDRGMYIETYEQNGFHSVIATSKPGNKRPAVLLNAHIDVVPAPKEMFELKLRNGRFYGRGVMDMKHAIASYLTLADTLKDEIHTYDFGIMITGDEETGSNNGAKPLVAMGYHPDVVVIPDGGNNWQLETFAKGVKWVKLESRGKAAHASRPWEGESATKKLLSAIHEIEKLVPKNPEPTDTLLSVGTISGGTTANQLPTEATAMLDIRTGSTEDHNKLNKQIQKICQNYDVAATFQADEPPCPSDPEHPLIKPMVEIVEEVTGKQHGTSYDYAVTDGRIFSATGMPTVVINPECGGIHSDNEWLSRKSYTQFCKAIELYVRRMAAQKPSTAELAKRLTPSHKASYVWFASYASGLSKENFMYQIAGGQLEGSARVFAGCTDKTPPAIDTFIALPHDLYFAGKCVEWGGGGHVFIQPDASPSARTIARAYLITVDQLEEIAAQQSGSNRRARLPLKEAMRDGHATIDNGEGAYDELVFCGLKDGVPILALTTSDRELPYTAPSPAYTQLLCKGLSENSTINKQTAIDYVSALPGVEGNYNKQDIARFFDKSTD